MHMKISSIILFGQAILGFAGFAAPFQNLGFDDANTNRLTIVSSNPLIPGPGGRGSAADLLPGWTLFSGNTTVSEIQLNTRLLGGGVYGNLISKEAEEFFQVPVDGRFALQTVGADPWFSLVQRGDLSADIRFLRYSYLGNSLRVFMDGVEVGDPFFSSSASMTNKVIDVSAFAGRTVELRFQGTREFGGAGPFTIDSVAFLVPEPGYLSLAAIGVLVLGFNYVNGTLRKRKTHIR
jgi:hypothetical protein